MLYRTDVWFSPEKVLLRYDQKMQALGAAFQKLPEYKTMREAQAAGLLLIGMQKMQGREYWMQLVNPKEQSPDIRSATQMIEIDNRLQTQDVEVVTLGPYVLENVDDFLRRTKLANTKTYPNDVTILCYIDRDTTVASWRDVSNALKQTGKKNDVFILGRTDKQAPKYQLARINPEIDHVIRFDASLDARVNRRHTMRFMRRTKRMEWKTDEKYEPF
jgi:hypothetical protein